MEKPDIDYIDMMLLHHPGTGDVAACGNRVETKVQRDIYGLEASTLETTTSEPSTSPTGQAVTEETKWDGSEYVTQEAQETDTGKRFWLHIFPAQERQNY